VHVTKQGTNWQEDPPYLQPTSLLLALYSLGLSTSWSLAPRALEP
jgi:hypothetical protein